MSGAAGEPPSGAGVLSSRAHKALAPPPGYLLASFAARESVYDAASNPGGVVDLSVAENRLSVPYVAKALADAPPADASQLTYGDMLGSRAFRAAIARVFAAHLTRAPVDPDHLAVTAGAGSTVDLLATLVCEEGDRVMITAPAYRGLETDVSARAGCNVVVAELDPDERFAVTVDALDAAWAGAGGNDSRIKLCIVCSPNNPTGQVLSRDTLRDIAKWANDREMHVAFDEVYGMSCFSGEKFVSAAEALDDGLLDTTHIVWSFSKDFCLSGCRMGVLYSRNQALLAAYANMSYFCSTSRHSQEQLTHVLQDDTWVSQYIQDNNRRLREAYERCASILDEFRIPYLPSQAGFFLCVDLSGWLESDTEEAEKRLWNRLVEAKVLLTPAAQMLSKNYGWYRMCFAAVSMENAEEGLARLQCTLRKVAEEKEASSQ